MKLEQIEIELLLLSTNGNNTAIYTHEGFNNNCKLSKESRIVLHDLAAEMAKNNFSVYLNDHIYTHLISSYNGGIVIAGIAIRKCVKAKKPKIEYTENDRNNCIRSTAEEILRKYQSKRQHQLQTGEITLHEFVTLSPLLHLDKTP